MKKSKLIDYLIQYIKYFLVDHPGTFEGKSSFSHDLNAYHWRDFKAQKEQFDHLHNALPLVLWFWKGEPTKLIEWLEKAKTNPGLQPPYDNNSNRELWWNLYYILRELKEPAV